MTEDRLLPHPRQVLAVRQENPDTWSLDVASEGPAPLPGQFHMLYAFGVGEVPISVSAASPGRTTYTIRAVGAVTRALTGTPPGGTIGVRGPFGTGWPLEEARGHDLVIMAGGLGLAPLRPAIHAVLADRDAYHQVSVLVGARAPDGLLYGPEWEDWRAAGIDVRATIDAATPGWDGHVGVVTTLVARAGFDPDDARSFVCGPEMHMMRFGAQELQKAGVDAARTWISMERNMKCAVGFCGHCQFGPAFICKDGPVLRQDRMAPLLAVREL